MRYFLLTTSVVASLGAITARGDNVLPAHPSFDRYSAMANRSPFAIATAVAVPAATPDFAKDLYVANAARLPGGDMVTIASSSDQNFKKYLIARQTVDGFTLDSIDWSDRVGATKVTISKGEKFATLTFNQALLSQRAAPNAPPTPGQVPQIMPPPPIVPSMPSAEQSKASRGVSQKNPKATAVPTPNPTPESPPRPDPPKVESVEQRQTKKIDQQRQLKTDSLRPVAPTQPGEEAYLDVRP